MGIFQCKCENENCGYEFEFIGSFAFIPICSKCNSNVYLVPSKSNFKVNGFAASNGYSGINN